MVLLVAACAGCASDPPIDLVGNEYIYRSPGYVAPRRTAQDVYVERLRDERQVPECDNWRQVFSDEEWQRPVTVMVEELLVDEVERSGIYRSVANRTRSEARPEDIVVEPTLLTMYRMREAPTGYEVGRRRSLAHVKLRLKVHGPQGASGERQVLLDDVFESQAATSPSLARPDNGMILLGRSMQKVMGQSLEKLYQANIPSVPGGSVEAAAPKRQ